MTWAIVADSSCNFRSFTPTADQASYGFVPFKIRVGEHEYVDDEGLDVATLTDAIACEQAATSSSCPSVGEWAERFRSADNVLAITISRNLSGSYEAAQMARNLVMEEYMLQHEGQIQGKNIFVLDSRASGGKLELLVEHVSDYLAQAARTFDEVVRFAQEIERASTVLFSLSSYENLIKNGRMPKLAGALATKLSIRMLGTANEQGTIRVIGSTRTEKKMIARVVESMAERGYHGGTVYIDHAQNQRGAERLKEAIQKRWQSAPVRILACSGLNSYYAERSGLIIGFEWA